MRTSSAAQFNVLAALAGASFPFVVLAEVAKATSLQAIEWDVWVTVALVSAGGWFMSSAESLAGWVKGEREQLLENRLKILKLFVMSMAAGFIAYLAGFVAGVPEIPNIIAVLLASFAGEQYLRKRIGAGADTPKGT